MRVELPVVPEANLTGFQIYFYLKYSVAISIVRCFNRMEKEEKTTLDRRTTTAVSSCVSMKSNLSIDRPVNIRNEAGPSNQK